MLGSFLSDAIDSLQFALPFSFARYSRHSHLQGPRLVALLEMLFPALLIASYLLTATAADSDDGSAGDGEDDFDPEEVQALWSAALEPPTMAFEIKFQASGESIREDALQYERDFVYPSHFKEIIIECNSSYPKKWTFSTNFIRDNNITTWHIDKTRFVDRGSIWNTSATYTFQTHLAMTFADGKDANLQYAFNCRHVRVPNLSSYISLITNKTNLTVRFVDGEEKPPALGRYNKNKDCELRLHIDRNSKKFGCSFARNGSSVGIHSYAVNCKNEDECTALAQSNTCTSSIVEGECPGACIYFVHRKSSGIFVCEVGEQFSKPSNYNSVAAVYYFSLSQPKKLYLDKERVPLQEKLTLQLLNSTTEVYVKETLVFNCTGLASYFSRGFYWILEYEGGRQEHLGSDSTPPNSKYLQESEAYTTLKVIDFNESSVEAPQSQQITVYCLGPRWNAYDWENVSMQIEFKNVRRNLNEPSQVSSTTRGILILLAIVLSFIALLLVFVFFGVYYIRKRTREARAFGLLTEDEINDFLHGDPNQDHAMFYPYNTDYEIGRGQFQIESKVLGDGQFGQVLRGTLGKAPVAVKTVKKCADIMYLKALLSELKIMCYVGRHENIVSLIGACTEAIDKREVYLLVKFCENGCLLSYLKTHRSTFLNYLSESAPPAPGALSSSDADVKPRKDSRISRERSSRWLKHQSVVNYQNATVKRVSSRDLLRWAHEIAAGMEHLSSKNVIHGDLAARNILLTANLTAKVGDFGLSKQLFDYSVYVQRIECPLPLRWMAVESLRDLEFSKESDVWSYGVTLYEIFSLGQLPYPAIQWDFDSWKLIRDGHRMEKPDYASDEVYRLMLECWHIDPMERPWFSELKENFLGLSRELEKRYPKYPSPPSLNASRASGSKHNSRIRSTLFPGRS